MTIRACGTGELEVLVELWYLRDAADVPCMTTETLRTSSDGMWHLRRTRECGFTRGLDGRLMASAAFVVLDAQMVRWVWLHDALRSMTNLAIRRTANRMRNLRGGFAAGLWHRGCGIQLR